jgi:molybdenum storage protein
MTEPLDVAGAKHLLSRLTAESLQSRELLRATDQQEVRRLLPKLIVVKLGGLSIIDRGPEALLPVVDQFAELAPDHQLLICTGEGTRARHAYAIATDLGLPVGMLSMLGNSAADQNARIVTSLLMDHGALHVPISLVPTLVTVGGMLIISGMPPYEWWEPPVPAGQGRIPEYRSDAGTFLIAEALGAEKVIYIKDVDGLYDRDPASGAGASLVGDISAGELLDRAYASLPLETVAVEMLSRARVVKRAQLVNGLTPGAVAAAVRGESVGSTISAG